MTRVGVRAAWVVMAFAGLGAACGGGGGAAECAPPGGAEAALGAASSSAPPDAAPWLPGASALAPTSAAGKLAKEVAIDLFAERWGAVVAHFTPSLKESVPEARLAEIVAGVVGAHGAPVALLDAWATEVKEDKEVTLPAAAALIRMKDEVRFRLLLVLTPDGAITGFWLRPI